MGKLFDYDSLLLGIAVISDVHLNAKRLLAKNIKKELREYFFEPLKRATVLTGVVVNGDLFHDNKLYLEDQNSGVVFWFFDELEKLATERNIWVRVIKGTHSHDYDQLEIFRSYEEEYNFKIYNKTTVEKINGLNMLFIPEEYVEDPDEYYKEFLNVSDDTYNYIFMHGLIKEMEFIHQDNTNFSKKAPIFSVDDLCRVCKGPILAGHIHTHTVFKNQFYYVGSFSRFSHGEEEDKGFVFVVMTTDTWEYVVLHHKNELAKVYMDYTLDFDDVEKLSIEGMIEKVTSFIEKKKVTSLKLKLNYIDTNENHAKISALIKFYEGSDIVKIKTKIATLKLAEKEKEKAKKREENKYLVDNTLTFYEKVKLYVEKTSGKNIPIETIQKFFTKEEDSKAV